MGGEDLVLRFIGLDLLSSVANAIGSKIDGLMKSVGSSGSELGQSFASVGKAAVGMGAGLLTVSAALAAVIVGATAMAGTFQAKMTLLHTQAGASTAEVQRMTQAVLDMAPAVGFGPDKLADAMYHVESLGFRGAAAIDLLNTAAKGAQIGNADLEATVNALGGALVAQIAGVNNAQQAMAVLDATVGVGNMRMQDLVSAMSTGIIPAGKNFGLTLQEIGGALATMTDNAVPADEAATRLRMTFALIGAPSAIAVKQLKTIGLSVLDLGKDMRSPAGLIGALTDLKGHLQKTFGPAALDDVNRYTQILATQGPAAADAYATSAGKAAYVITRAFGGGRSSAGIMTLLNNLDRLKQRTDTISSMTGTFGERFAERSQNLTFRVDQLKAAFERAIIVLGTALIPVVERVVGFIVPIISAIGAWIEQHQKLTAAILVGAVIFAALAGVFLVVFGVIAIVIGGILALVVALPLIGAAITPILIAIGITLGVMAALIAIVIAVVIAIQHWQDIKRIAVDVWGFVGPYVMTVISSIQEAIRLFIDAVGHWWQEHHDNVERIWNGIVEQFRFAWAAIVAIVTTAVELLSPFVEAWLRSLWAIISTIWDSITGVIRVAWDTITTIFTVALDLLSGDWNKAWVDLKSGVAQIFSDIVNAALHFGGDLVNAIITGITGIGGAIGKTIERFMPAPLKKFLGIGQDVGSNVGAGIVAGLSAQQPLIDRGMEKLNQSLMPSPQITGARPAGKVADDTLPTRTTTTARAVAPPEQSGLSKAWDSVRRTINSMLNGIGTDLNTHVTNFGKTWQRFAADPAYWVGYAAGRVIFGMSNMHAGIQRWVNASLETIVTFVGNAFQAFNKFFTQDLPTAVGKGFAAANTATQTWVANTYASAVKAGTDFLAAVNRFFSGLGPAIQKWLSDATAAIGRWADGLRKQASDSANNFITGLGDAFKGIGKSMEQVGHDIVNGITKGISDMIQSGKDAIGNFVKGLISAAHDAGKGGSPYRLFATEVGATGIAGGVIMGLDESRSGAQRAMAEFIAGLSDAVVSPVGFGVALPATGSRAAAAGGVAARAVGTTHVSVNAGDNGAAISTLTDVVDDRLSTAIELLRAIAEDNGISGKFASQLRNG